MSDNARMCRVGLTVANLEQEVDRLEELNRRLAKENYELGIYRKALDKWGDLQVLIAFEEMAELQKEICKNMRGKENRGEIAEEIADVEIVLGQLKLYYGIAEGVRRHKEYKLKRLEGKLRCSE